MPIHTLSSPWGRFGLYSYFIDAPEPAIVDTGIASSPAEGIVPALEAIGRRIEDVRWILLTHGHIDHVGGAHALWELTGRRAQVVIHEADAPLLRSRRAHVEEYLDGRGQYLRDPEGEAKQVAATEAAISGEIEPTMLLTRWRDDLPRRRCHRLRPRDPGPHAPGPSRTSWTARTTCSSATPSRCTAPRTASPATTIRSHTARA